MIILTIRPKVLLLHGTIALSASKSWSMLIEQCSTINTLKLNHEAQDVVQYETIIFNALFTDTILLYNLQ